MFPTGIAGAALFVFRLSVALTYVVYGTAHWSVSTSFWILLGIIIPALFLSLGFLTPYISVICGLVELAGCLMLTRGNFDFQQLVPVVNCGVLAALGPGAYSIDAHIFGRRLIALPPQ